MTRQAGAVRAGAFHPHPREDPEHLKPRTQLEVASRCRYERLDTQHAAVRVDRSRDMHTQMRIDTTRDQARALYDGHRHPFCSSKRFKGWHARPGKETVTIDLLLQDDQSPSGTGRAQFRTHANDQHASDPNVPVTTTTAVDPLILTGQSGARSRPQARLRSRVGWRASLPTFRGR